MGDVKEAGNGDGSVYFDDEKKRWRCQLTVKTGRTLPTGRPETRRIGRSFRSKTEAKAWSKKTQADEAAGLLFPELVEVPDVPVVLTVAECSVRWMTSAEKRLKPKTLCGYGQMLRLYLLPALGATPIDQLTGTQVQDHYNGLYAADYSRDTVRHAHMVLRQVIKHAYRTELLSANRQDPTRFVDSTPPRNREEKLNEAEENLEHDTFDPKKAWTPEQVELFQNVTRDDRDGQILLLLLGTGLRRGEACGLQWQHVDLEAGNLRVAKHLVMVGKTPTLDTPKTKDSNRVVSLGKDEVALLRHQKLRQAQEEAARKAAGKEWASSGDGYVFRTLDGKFIHPDSLRKVLARLATAAGIPRIRIHELRDTYVTLMARSGIKIELISKLVGHSDPAFTMKRYRQVQPDETKAAVLGLSEMIERSKSGAGAKKDVDAESALPDPA